ncbi:MAG: [protein-PII] uridylyltransferase [Planctomycetales bacterium]|nr:[protein-PII] uridylyltransferase [Planctomycetales bacterium]
MSHIRKSIVSARERLAEGREKAKQQHLNGTPGVQVGNYLADIVDGILLEIFEQALYQAEPTGRLTLSSYVALVPHGGYGRRDLAPYSDVDLMLLRHRSAPEDQLNDLARRIVCDLSDVGFDAGFSVRTPFEACRLPVSEPKILSSQAESRFLGGSVRLYARFMHRFRRQTRRRAAVVVPEMLESREAERKQYGETVFLLEPNIKRSRGGLRDIQLLRWLGFARFGESDLSKLWRMGVLPEEDYQGLRAALEFLLRLRNEMHFHAGKANDVLYRGEQVRIADAWHYESTPNLLPVEAFMRDYFGHTRRVRDIVKHFAASATLDSWTRLAFEPLFSHRRDGHFRVSHSRIGLSRRGLQLVHGNLEEILRLMDLANHTDSMIEHRTWQAIRNDMMTRDDWEVTPGAAARFMAILTRLPRLGNLLRRLHEVGVLGKLVEGFEHARCLLQFNTYHKYTVDEHCIRSVERATEFAEREDTLGDIYRGLEQRNILHLALLIHDVGKGFSEDHCEVGARMALETCRLLGLSKRDTGVVHFLVKNHLLLSHLAFRRDTSDESVIVQFASQVGSPELLKMLFVMTAADFAAVGPDVLNPWKVEVLTGVFQRAMDHLSGGRTSQADLAVAQRREELRRRVAGKDAQWYRDQVDALPSAYLFDVDSNRILETLQELHELPREKASAQGHYLPEQHVTEYSIAAYDGIVPGIFHRLAGALTSRGLTILSAQIHTLSDALILDRFVVEDHDYASGPPQSRLDEVCATLVRALEQPSDQPPPQRRIWRSSVRQDVQPLVTMPTRVVIDNSTSAEFTIVDIFTHDRPNLLYAITRTLYELGTSVCTAKIGTYLDQVVDVFYIVDRGGSRITDENRLEEIQGRLAQAIEELEVQASTP